MTRPSRLSDKAEPDLGKLLHIHCSQRFHGKSGLEDHYDGLPFSWNTMGSIASCRFKLKSAQAQ